MKNREYAEVLICAAGDLVHHSAASDAFRSMIRSGMHRKLSTNDIHKRVLDVEYAAAARIDSVIDAIDGEIAPMANKELQEDILGYTPDQLADQLLALAKRLLRDGAVVEGDGPAASAPSTDASPTHQVAATSRDQEPVMVVVRPGFGGEPAGARIESELKAAGIPARVGPTGIEVKFGKVEWQVECDGDVVVQWWPAGR